MTQSRTAESDFGELPGIDDAGWIGAGVERVLDSFLEARMAAAVAAQLPVDLIAVLRDFLLSGGKRVRPTLCVMGWLAAGGHGDARSTLRLAAALEMFHAFALIHDDIMDDSATRRGKPAVQHILGERYAREERPFPARLGVSGAILVGDLALVWADELVHTAGLSAEQLAVVLPLLDAMRTELMFGQYLDVMSTGRPTADVELAIRVAHYKTARYTVACPLLIGATVAGAAPDIKAALHDYAIPIGEAFQLRDDLLSVYGDRRVTGKPLFDDLRQGKHTALVAVALRRADPVSRAMLGGWLGDSALADADAERVRDLLDSVGARAEVEALIAGRREQAMRVLDTAVFPQAVAAFLREFAVFATVRAS